VDSAVDIHYTPESFVVVSPTAQATRDADWIRRNIDRRYSDIPTMQYTMQYSNDGYYSSLTRFFFAYSLTRFFFAYSLTRLFFAYSLPHSLAHSLAPSFTHSLPHSLTPSLPRSFTLSPPHATASHTPTRSTYGCEEQVVVTDVSGATAVIGIMGPQSRELLRLATSPYANAAEVLEDGEGGWCHCECSQLE
jgi:hypothetical protein